MKDLLDALCAHIAGLDFADRVDALNEARRALHAVSPFLAEPVDLVQWVRSGDVRGNDYNPNSVAPPEMRLLAHSIACDGYTQPVVVHDAGDGVEVVDGFHRYRVSREDAEVRDRVKGYLPVTHIKVERTGEADRMAATIRHNRARGKHRVDAMSEIVRDLARRNWNDAKIARELGMDADEVLRLKQVTGLADLFADEEFSEAWDAAPGDAT